MRLGARKRSSTIARTCAALLVALVGCTWSGEATDPSTETTESAAKPAPERSWDIAEPEPPAPDDSGPRPTDTALGRAEAAALVQQERARALELEFIALLGTDRDRAKRRAARRVRHAYLLLATATDEYRAALRNALGARARAELLDPFKKQTRGLRLATQGLDDYRRALRADDRKLAREGLRRMDRGERLMRRAEADLAEATGGIVKPPARTF
jgi:hypothetical protein